MTTNRALWLTFAAVVVALIVTALPALAQSSVSDDQVNAVASRLYCPVCANVPLDVCATQACYQWKEEIRADLANGKTSDEIVAKFVAQFGQRVVGTPQDPTLRALALVTPWLLAGLALVVGVVTVLRWRAMRGRPTAATASDSAPVAGDDALRSRLEADLTDRR
jgi:cytochrome c-type biogenesis protein CcmH/NrfF